MLTATPWARINDPVPIPDQVDKTHLAGLDDEHFRTLLHHNLLPGRDNRAAWESLWQALKVDADLRDRSFDVLEDLLDEVTTAFERTGPDTADPQQLKRMTKFEANVNMSLDRLERVRPNHKPVSGDYRAALATVNAPGRRAVKSLIAAIETHRECVGVEHATDADHELWNVLTEFTA